MNEQQESVSLIVSLTVSLTSEVPEGLKTTTAIVCDDSEPKKNNGAERQRKLEAKKRASGLEKDWVPLELIELAKAEGWSEVVRRAKAKRSFWQFLISEITRRCRAFLKQLKSVGFIAR